MSRRRQKNPPPGVFSAYVLAPSGTYAKLIARHRPLFDAAVRGDTDASSVLLDAFADLGALVFPFDSPDGKREARSRAETSFLNDERDDLEIYFVGVAPTELGGGEVYRGRRERRTDLKGESWSFVDYVATRESRGGRRGYMGRKPRG